MEAIDAWKRIPYPTRRKIIDALNSATVRNAVAEVCDPPNPMNELNGAEMTKDEEHALGMALALIDEADNA